MTQKINDSIVMPHKNLDCIREFLLLKLGLEFSKTREKDLYAKLKEAAKGFDFDNTELFIDWLKRQPLDNEQSKLLASYLTVGETYFFREKKALDYLEQIYLPELIRKRKGKSQQLRIWSAGCATGEEPYSIAILLQKVIPDIKNWNITINATDINPTFIDKAKKGIYSNWSFRKTPESFKTNHFQKLDKNFYQINDSIKKMVTFSFLNLASDNYPSPKNNTSNFDIILCRNVLIYFSAEGIKTVTSKFYESLIKQGILLVSPVETSSLLSSQFEPVSHPGNTIFKKGVGNKNILSETTVLKSFNTRLTEIKRLRGIQEKKAVLKSFYQTDTKTNSKRPEYLSENKETEESLSVNYEYENALELYNSGLLDEAEKLLNTLITKKRSSQKLCFLLLAKIYANQGQLAKSAECCHKTIHSDKINIEAHYLLSNVYNEQGEIKEATNSLNNTLFLDPDFVMAHFLLGNIYMKTGEISKCKKHFENALKSLSKYNTEEILATSDGLTAGRLTEIINSIKPIKQLAEVS
jgi:chemotaxis protein methyltransferase CheR